MKNGFGEAVVACDMSEPCKFPSLDRGVGVNVGLEAPDQGPKDTETLQTCSGSSEKQLGDCRLSNSDPVNVFNNR